MYDDDFRGVGLVKRLCVQDGPVHCDLGACRVFGDGWFDDVVPQVSIYPMMKRPAAMTGMAKMILSIVFRNFFLGSAIDQTFRGWEKMMPVGGNSIAGSRDSETFRWVYGYPFCA